MPKATWNGTVIAESDDTVVLEGSHYFPMSSIRSENFRPSDRSTICPWKGKAAYYDVIVNGERNPGAAWYYPAPEPAAEQIRGRVAFWKGVRVE